MVEKTETEKRKFIYQLVLTVYVYEYVDDDSWKNTTLLKAF